MKSSETAAKNGQSEKEAAYREHFAWLRDRLLLHIRDGEWHKLADIASYLAPRIDPVLAVHRYFKGGGVHKKLPDMAGPGQALILKDLVTALQREKLIAHRKSDEGQEEVRSTPLCASCLC